MVPSSFSDVAVHLTGIKGTGMAALAEILVERGARVSGSDVSERFFTDELLEARAIVPRVGFDARNIPPDVQLLVYSGAYGEDNPERIEAAQRGIPSYSYTQTLGALSRGVPSLAIAGVHGKTSTAAMAGGILRASGDAATVVVGSSVPDFGGSATLQQGNDWFVAETCEYRRNFLDFFPDVLVVTSIEADHLDYFSGMEDIFGAFTEFAGRLPDTGSLVVCHDDAGAERLARWTETHRPDVRVRRYGRGAGADIRISEEHIASGAQHFSLSGLGGWSIGVPGAHMVQNAAAAIVGLRTLMGKDDLPVQSAWRDALSRFGGTRRRSELVGMAGGIRIMDDYAHHPTAIRTTLAGYRAFWPGARIIVDFMSHTYSRTMALRDDFANAFADADILYLNDIYGSARETAPIDYSGTHFAADVARAHPDVRYVPDFDQASWLISEELRRGDVFVTMGAGNNARIGRAVMKRILQKTEA